MGQNYLFFPVKQPVSSEVSLRSTVMLNPSALAAALDQLIECRLQIKACDRATIGHLLPFCYLQRQPVCILATQDYYNWFKEMQTSQSISFLLWI